EMIEDWLVERRFFRAGTFPAVSTTGSWHDVGHYTQLIWPQTSSVGCAMAVTADIDYLVCRYGAPGNVMGQAVGVRANAEFETCCVSSAPRKLASR
ncbi:MAG: CAP domain-containing protein, partial [Nitrobacter sp.]